MANFIIAHIWISFNIEEEIFYMISYQPLWDTLKRKGITQYELINKYKVSAGQLSRLRANNNVSTNTLNTLCEILDCQISDIVCYVKKGN